MEHGGGGDTTSVEYFETLCLSNACMGEIESTEKWKF